MTSPKLSVASSGFGGRGYRDLFGSGDILPSITTALGALEKPGIARWQREQIALHAITHVEELTRRTEAAAYGYLMAVPKFLTPEKVDDLGLEVDIWNAAEYALDETADAGTWMHQYAEDDLLNNFPEDPLRDDHYEMVEAWHAWKAEHDIEVIATERTVFGDGYAGTADLFAKIDGVVYCVDYKTSRAVRETHIAQLGAVGAAHTSAREVPEGTPDAVYHKIQPKIAAEHRGQVDSWWVPEPLPDFQAYAVIQIRPHDVDTRGTYIDPFVEMHTISHAKVEAGYRLFRAGLDARMAQRELKTLEKEEKDASQ